MTEVVYRVIIWCYCKEQGRAGVLTNTPHSSMAFHEEINYQVVNARVKQMLKIGPLLKINLYVLQLNLAIYYLSCI